jgi:hypothetical protein
MSNYLMGGTYQSTRWTEPITIKDTNPETSGLFREGITLETVEKYLSCNQEYKNLRRNLMTYDLAFAGPQNRFTVLTDAGPIIVHNCGYGTGWKKLQSELKAAGVTLPDNECKEMIRVYRSASDKIIKMWWEAKAALTSMINAEDYKIGVQNCMKFHHDGFVLPSGYKILYPNMGFVEEDGNQSFHYVGRKGKTYLWSGSVVENIVQGLARCVISDQMLLIAKRYRPVLTVHDAVAIVVPQDEKDEAIKFIEECMSTVPVWAQGLPVACESGHGYSYGDC